ncbi:MAG TPA: secretin N-terminal domain-containing protein, partial [Planctomycetota bacterium]|nr:secretin N-terminal domain-containing protein [Planctomycetota bacterium]
MRSMLPLAFVALAAVSCALVPAQRRSTRSVETARAPASAERTPTAAKPPPEPEPIVRVNRTLIYPMHWTRAEDLAPTLEAVLQSRYGPGARVIAHSPSNRLLIVLPPREMVGAS